jgi:hypothetical protein
MFTWQKKSLSHSAGSTAGNKTPGTKGERSFVPVLICLVNLPAAAKDKLQTLSFRHQLQQIVAGHDANRHSVADD